MGELEFRSLDQINLKGLLCPVEPDERKYPNRVPVTPCEYLIKDDEIAARLDFLNCDVTFRFK